jgi:putative transcription factor
MIEGSEMQVCDACAGYGTPVEEKKRAAPVTAKTRRVEPYSGKDPFADMDTELIDNWGKQVMQARQQQDMSREQLGSLIEEKTTTVAKIENEELRPSDETAKRIERALGISLFEKVSKGVTQKKDVRGLTIGDLLKQDE